jgi:hypothetical protein
LPSSSGVCTSEHVTGFHGVVDVKVELGQTTLKSAGDFAVLLRFSLTRPEAFNVVSMLPDRQLGSGFERVEASVR